MSKMQKIWAEAHSVTRGQIIPEGMEFIEADTIDGIKVSDLTVAVAAMDIEVSDHTEIYLRTLEPLPDTDVTVNNWSVEVEVTRNQDRSFAGKLLETFVDTEYTIEDPLGDTITFLTTGGNDSVMISIPVNTDNMSEDLAIIVLDKQDIARLVAHLDLPEVSNA